MVYDEIKINHSRKSDVRETPVNIRRNIMTADKLTLDQKMEIRQRAGIRGYKPSGHYKAAVYASNFVVIGGTVLNVNFYSIFGILGLLTTVGIGLVVTGIAIIRISHLVNSGLDLTGAETRIVRAQIKVGERTA